VKRKKLKVSKLHGSLFPIAKQEAMAEGEVMNIWHSTIP
jgi:hypothetical protein